MTTSAMEIDSQSSLININLGIKRTNPVIVEPAPIQLFTPGKVVTTEKGVLRGHGTYEENGELKASVAGIRECVSKLVLVHPVRSRYSGEIGDVVVGRIVEVQQKRWKVHINARLDAVLLLSAVNLPGGELRRRSVEDERRMRKYLSEGDLISAEIQNIYSDGALSLHTRSLKYGKLAQGVLVVIPSSLVKRCKTHFFNICGASVIVGNNGFVWLYPTPASAEEGAGGFAKNIDLKIEREERDAIIRMRACILSLVNSKMLVYDTSIVRAFEISLKYELQELVLEQVMVDIALQTRLQMSCQEMM